jgi:hypothetical protein
MPQQDVAQRRNHVSALITKVSTPLHSVWDNFKTTETDKRKRLDALLNNVRSEISFSPQQKRTHRFSNDWTPAPKKQIGESWCSRGFFPNNVYRVEDLVAVWKSAYVKYRPDENPPPYAWWLRKHLLQWLKEDGRLHCEAVTEYAIKMWTPLARQFQIVDADTPNLHLIYGFRKGIAAEMNRTQNRKWGSSPKPTEDYYHADLQNEVIFS